MSSLEDVERSGEISNPLVLRQIGVLPARHAVCR